MAIVNLTIRNTPYQIACDDGQEEKLREVAFRLDKRLTDLGRQLGRANEKMLNIMALLMLEDQLAELQKNITELQKKLANGGGAPNNDPEGNKAVASALDVIADYAETLAGKLEKL